MAAKRRVEIRRLENKAQKMVTFSKRHRGLFSKAQQYSNTTGSHVAVLVFSPAGKPFVYGSSSFEAVIDSYLNADRSGSDAWEAFAGLEEKAAAAKSVEELMTMKAMLGEVRETILKKLKDLEEDNFVGSLLRN